MNTSKLLKSSVQALTSVLIFQIIVNPIAILAQSDSTVKPVTEVEPPTPADGTAEDLRNLDSGDNATGTWGIGGGESLDPINSQSQSPYDQITENESVDPTSLELQQDDQEWRGTNRGDVPNTGAKIPVSRF